MDIEEVSHEKKKAANMVKTASETNQHRLPTTDERIAIQGLVSAARHNGKTGIVIQYDKSSRRYKIKILGDDKKAQYLAVKPANILLKDDKNKKDWDDRLTHVLIPCHTSDARRHEQFRQCARSLATQCGRCRILVGVSGSDETMRLKAMDTLRMAATLPASAGNHHQWFVIEATNHNTSQFQHYQSLLPISMALNPYAWLMFLDNDDMFHPMRVYWFQEQAKKLKDNEEMDGFYCGGKLLIDDKIAREKFGDNEAIPLEMFLEGDKSLDGIVDVAATEEENAEKDVTEYFDFCIRSTRLKKFLALTPDLLLAHRFCDVRFADCTQKLKIVKRDHPREEWLLMHYRIRLTDRHELFLNRDTKSRKSAMVSVSISDHDRAMAEETGLQVEEIAFLRKNVEENVIMMIERDDEGLEHRRKLTVSLLDKRYDNNIVSRLWQETCNMFSASFAEDLARKNRQWSAASKQQQYNLVEDQDQTGFF